MLGEEGRRARAAIATLDDAAMPIAEDVLRSIANAILEVAVQLDRIHDELESLRRQGRGI